MESESDLVEWFNDRNQIVFHDIGQLTDRYHHNDQFALKFANPIPPDSLLSTLIHFLRPT
jgi:hypothetical protein